MTLHPPLPVCHQLKVTANALHFIEPTVDRPELSEFDLLRTELVDKESTYLFKSDRVGPNEFKVGRYFNFLTMIRSGITYNSYRQLFIPDRMTVELFNTCCGEFLSENGGTESKPEASCNAPVKLIILRR